MKALLHFPARAFIALFLSLLAGIAVWYIDSRPGWDDTGISAMLIFIAALVPSLVYSRLFLLWALVSGIWVPLAGMLNTSNPLYFLILLFSFAGATSGWLLIKLAKGRTT
ncbi:MAG: hypothetical protein U0X39_09790 [Bacteroidales bacterium]